MNIVDPILFQCETQPKAAALCAPGSNIGLISYGRLAQFIHNISRTIRKLGLAPKQLVAVSIQDEIFQAAVMLALARLGIVIVSRYEDRFASVVKVDAVITDSPAAFVNAPQLILADLSWTRGDGTPLAPDQCPPIVPGDICCVCFTSGSTGEPKAVALSHDTLAARAASHLFVYGSRFPSSQRVYCDMPISNAAGIQVFVSTLCRGGTFFFPGATFEATIDGFEEYRVQCCAASPGGLEMLLKGYDRYPTLQSELETVVVAGDMFPKALSDRVRARLCSHVVSVYGAAETGITASAPVQLTSDTPGAVGFVVPGVTVQIMDEAGTRQAAGVEGLVAIRNPRAVDRYLGDPAATARTFRDGWFFPGDIGALDANNLLRITGRRDAVLNLGGDKINPERIEGVLAGCEGLRECAVFGVANALGVEEMWVAIVAQSTLSDDQLRAYCETHLGRQLVPARFVRVASLPRNQMGKIDRRQLPNLAKR